MDESMAAAPVTPAPAPAPVVADSLVTTVGTAVAKVVADFKADKAKGPITMSEAIALLEELVVAGCSVLKPIMAPGTDVTGLLTAVLMDVYTKEIRPLELQHFGVIVSTAMIDPMIHQAIPLLVESAKKLLLAL